MNISDLQDLKLTEEEWHALMHMGELEPNRAHLDMLVLAGLAVRTSIHPPEWDLTEAGHEACNAIDLVLDWDDFVFKASESPSEASEEPAEVDTVAELVRLAEALEEDSEEPAEVDTVAEDMVFLNGEPIKRSEAMERAFKAPGRISVGSLVRHQHHGLGMVIDHFMWDGDWGGFKIKLVKPSQTGPTTSISEISDRADAFQLVS